jgi:hypothetical protein
MSTPDRSGEPDAASTAAGDEQVSARVLEASEGPALRDPKLNSALRPPGTGRRGDPHRAGAAQDRRRAFRLRRPNRVRMTRSRRIRALAAAFPHVPASLFVELARELEAARFRPGEAIVREGDPADCFYMIESGQVDATQASAQGEVHLEAWARVSSSARSGYWRASGARRPSER